MKNTPLQIALDSLLDYALTVNRLKRQSVRDAALSADMITRICACMDGLLYGDFDPLTEPLKIVELVERHTDPNAPPEEIVQTMSRIIVEVATARTIRLIAQTMDGEAP
jgi:hypothetical protein